MATLTVRGLDDDVKSGLRRLAAAHGRSMEAEARDILRAAVGNAGGTGADLVRRIQARFAGLDTDVDDALGQPSRTEVPRAPDLSW